MKYFACLLLLLSFAASAEEVADCSEIANAVDRLSCFDQHFPRKDSAPTVPENQTEVNPTSDEASTGEPASIPEESLPDTSQTAAAAAAAAAAESAAAPQESPVPPDTKQSAAEAATASVQPESRVLSEPKQSTTDSEPDTLKKGAIFGRDPRIELTTTITSIRRGDQQKMVFLLENDEVWMQATPRRMPFREGDTVTIKNASVGGYFMRTENGASTRVSRIK